MSDKSLLTRLGETIDQYCRDRQSTQTIPTMAKRYPHLLSWRWWLPTPGNVLFTMLVISSLLWAQNVGAISLGAPLAATTSTAGIPYQGRLANSSGQPLTQTVNMIFRLYAAASGGSPLWEEQWTGSNSVQVSDGLFNVMLGSLTPIPQAVITGNSNLFLGITVGTDSEMIPRVQLGSVPFATQALTVPDGSITKAKLASDVSLVPPDGSITTAKIANDAVELSRIYDWSSNYDYVVENAASGGNVTVDSLLSINVPTGKAYYFLVNYQGEFSYNFNERVGASSGFYGQWDASLLANNTTVGVQTAIVRTGYRQDWANLGGSWYWNQKYQAVWFVRLTEGTHTLKILVQGYSDNSMNQAHLKRQQMQVIRVY